MSDYEPPTTREIWIKATIEFVKENPLIVLAALFGVIMLVV